MLELTREDFSLAVESKSHFLGDFYWASGLLFCGLGLQWLSWREKLKLSLGFCCFEKHS